MNDGDLISAVVPVVGLWLTVEKIIHHDEIPFVIIRPRGLIASSDPAPCDARVVKHDAKKRKTPLAGRCRHKTAKYPFPIDAEIFDKSAASVMIPEPFSRTISVWLVNV